MAQKGQHNHYSIKFLKGYGFSIKVKNSKIILKNTADPFSEPFVDSDGKIKYTFEMQKVGTLKQNLLKVMFDNIGKISKVTRELDINADRGRFWLGKLTDVRKKKTNYSTPFSFPEFDPDNI